MKIGENSGFRGTVNINATEPLRELLLQQQGINKQLDLDKGDAQAAPANDNMPQEEEAPDTFVDRLAAERGKRREVEPAA